MSHRILITGGSGYLGGTLLARLQDAQLPAYEKLFALVRKPEQAEAVEQYSAEPLTIDSPNPRSISQIIFNNKITIVFHLHDARDHDTTPYSIEALGQVKKETGLETHFLFTSGAKLFSEFTSMPTDQSLLDTDSELYDLQKSAIGRSPYTFFKPAVEANCTVIEAAKKHSVRSYIFAPCIVYGKGEGFGNRISIQTVAIVQAAKALRQVYRVDKGKPSWPVCHVLDNTSLYIELMCGMLEGKEMGHGKNGFYLASPGSVVWDDIYNAFSRELKKADVVDDEVVRDATFEIEEKMDAALGQPAKLALGGSCTFTSANGSKIGWKPKFQPKHIIDAAEDEVNHILQHLLI